MLKGFNVSPSFGDIAFIKTKSGEKESIFSTLLLLICPTFGSNFTFSSG